MRLRHISILKDVASILVITDDPVVVNPETDSKNASVKETNVSPRKKGSAPKNPTAVQPNATMAIPSRWLKKSISDFLPKKTKQKPEIIVIAMDSIIGISWPSL
jgi:hypothetical protein